MKNKVHVHVSITCTSFIHNTTWSDRNVHVYIDVHVMLKYICKIVKQDMFQKELFCHFMNYFIYMYLHYTGIYIFLKNLETECLLQW